MPASVCGYSTAGEPFGACTCSGYSIIIESLFDAAFSYRVFTQGAVLHMLTDTPSSTATASLASSGRPERTSLQVSVDGFFWRELDQATFPKKKKVAACC